MKYYTLLIPLCAFFIFLTQAMEKQEIIKPLNRLNCTYELSKKPCVSASDLTEERSSIFSKLAQEYDRRLTDSVITEAYLASIRSLIVKFRINEVNAEGMTPLHNAVLRGEPRAVKLLLEYGALLNAQTSKGKTPLHLACSCNKVAIIKILLNAGADVTLKDNDGNMPSYNVLMSLSVTS